MILPIQSDVPPLNQGEDGVIRVSGTRIPLERIVRAFRGGATPEQIAQDFDVLSIESVYSVINYYLHHRIEVDAYLAGADEDTQETRLKVEEQFDPSGIRARLIERHRTETA